MTMAGSFMPLEDAGEFVCRCNRDGERVFPRYGAKVGEAIVRCRDCKHMHAVRHWLGMDVDECWLHADRESGALGKERTEPDGFCAWGERRDA